MPGGTLIPFYPDRQLSKSETYYMLKECEKYKKSQLKKNPSSNNTAEASNNTAEASKNNAEALF